MDDEGREERQVKTPKPGEVVYLNSGSPGLTVSQVDPDQTANTELDRVTVVWTDNEGACHSEVIFAVCLQGVRSQWDDRHGRWVGGAK